MSDAKARHFKPHSRFPFVTSIWWCLNNSARERRKAYTRHHRYHHHHQHLLHHHYRTISRLLLLAIAIVVVCIIFGDTIRSSFLFLSQGSSTLTAKFKNTPRRTHDPIRATIGLANPPTFPFFNPPALPSRQRERQYALAFVGHPRYANPRPRDLDNATLVSGCH